MDDDAAWMWTWTSKQADILKECGGVKKGSAAISFDGFFLQKADLLF